MASLRWAWAFGACANTSTRAVSSVHVAQRSFAVFAARPHAPSTNTSPPFIRRGSSVATASDPDTPVARMDLPENPIQGSSTPFLTLKGAISDATLKAIIEKPFKLTHMSAVQAEVLPLLPALADPYNKDAPSDSPPRDLLVKAKTGTGKTLGFLVPAIEARLRALEEHGKAAVRDAGLVSDKILEERARRVFARERVGTLIISPTRELATQIANEALRLTVHHEHFAVRLLVGGASKRNQMREWMSRRRDIVVATPGRLRDLLASEPEVVRSIAHTQLLILDEADTLLDMGFRDDIEAIKEFLPPVPERQTFLFSATVSRAIQQIARSTLAKNHKFVNCVTDDASPVHAHVEQYHTVLPSAGHQIPHVLRLLAQDQLSNPGRSKTVLFLPTTKMTQLFATLLRELGHSTLPAGRNTKVYEIHSKRTQESRTAASDRFRNDKSGASILVTSDVSARGVDYPGVTRVIQVGIPGSAEQYVHRVGRTGRAGTQGRGDLVLLPWEIGFVTCQLTDVPLKPLTINELTTQTKDLAKRYDENPTEFFPASPQTPVRLGRGSAPEMFRTPVLRLGRESAPEMFRTPVLATIEDIERSVAEVLAKIDEAAVNETFMSLLGYYMGKTPELRTQKNVIVEGCKTWATDACGLPAPPYVSPGFLQKIGMGDGRTSHFGKAMKPGGYGRAEPGASWLSRGRTNSYSADRRVGRDFGHRNDDSADVSEYRGRRYGDSESAVEPREARFQGSGGRGGRYESRNDDGGGYRGQRDSGSDRGQYRGRSEGGDRAGYGGRSDRGGDRGGSSRFGGMKDAGEAGYGIRRS